VLKDEELANDIARIKSKERILKKVQSRIRKLDNKIKKKRSTAS
jgi:hypothetical protein